MRLPITVPIRQWGVILLGGVLAVFVCGIAHAADNRSSPNVVLNVHGWVAARPDFFAPASGPGPVMQDPAVPHTYPVAGGLHGRNGSDSDQFRIADISNPILQPWTREAVKKVNQHILAGGAGFPIKVSCRPMGVPAFLLYPSTPIYFFQLPDKILILTEEDHMVRRVYLNVPHSKNIKPSWFGESVGHYEGGTLVVDTIGLNTKTFVDDFRTPHTEKLHVVERFHPNPGGKTMDVDALIEDPGAFTTPFHAIQHYSRSDDHLSEEICADNMQHFGDIDPFPESDKPDF